jgi:hypothetical protein
MKGSRALRCLLWLGGSVVACKKSPVEPKPVVVQGTGTAPAIFSVNSPMKDEDPSVLLAADGTMYVAWFSDRNGNAELYVSKSADRVTWTQPVRLGSPQWADYYPNLLQDRTGRIHLVWFQWVSSFVGQIRHSSSLDGVTWAPEDFVTTEFLLDDWLPTIAEAPDGTLVVIFVNSKRDTATGNNQLYRVTRSPTQTTWSAPVAMSVNSATEHDHLPFIARTGAGELTLVWSRFAGVPDFIANPRSDLMMSKSADGLTWSTPIRVTSDQRGQSLFPTMYQKHDGTWSLLWLSTRTGSPLMYELPVASASSFPTGLKENALLPPGYSHRVSRTPVSGEYLAAWVQGPKNVEDVYFRLIKPAP